MASISWSSSSDLGDCIGMENGCTDMEAIDELLFPSKKDDNNNNGAVLLEPKNPTLYSKRLGKELVRKEFPPPIPLLARTENLAAHMPWVLKRQYTSDGRLVLHKVKVRHHEYFKAHRENGHLTLQLVPMNIDFISQFPPDDDTFDDDEWEDNVDHQNDEEEQEAFQDNEEVNEEQEEGEDADEEAELLEESMAKIVCSKPSDTFEGSGGGGGVGGGVGGKCLNYDNSSSNTSSMFGLQE